MCEAQSAIHESDAVVNTSAVMIGQWLGAQESGVGISHYASDKGDSDRKISALLANVVPINFFN